MRERPPTLRRTGRGGGSGRRGAFAAPRVPEPARAGRRRCCRRAGRGWGVSGYWGYLNRRGLGDGCSGRGGAVGGYPHPISAASWYCSAGIGQRVLFSGYWAAGIRQRVLGSGYSSAGIGRRVYGSGYWAAGIGQRVLGVGVSPRPVNVGANVVNVGVDDDSETARPPGRQRAGDSSAIPGDSAAKIAWGRWLDVS